ncbi:unnamed protein product, partial [Closterium sp. NIES-54]
VKRPPGSPPAFKARYVARGFSQRQGVDYFQTFSPTPKMTTLRVLLHVAAQRDYELHSLDFSTAFLQGSLHEEIWLRRPPGFTGSFPTGTQWSLCRPVYDLRQAPCEWHNTLRTTLAALGFVPSTADPSLFLRTDTSLPPFYVLVHSLSAPPSDESVEPCGPYPELVGCLMYLMTCTRPHLAYPLSLLARYVAPGRHRKVHWDAAKRVLRYLCSRSGMGLVLGGRGPVVLTGHADASWVVTEFHDNPASEQHVTAVESYCSVVLGHVISRDGINIDPAQIKTIQEWKSPTNVTELQIFLGFVNYVRRFIPNMVGITGPLTDRSECPRAAPPAAWCLPCSSCGPLSARPACCATMASLRVLAFDHERRPLQFDTWLDDLQVYLLSDSRDSVSLFDHTSGAAPAPPATADSATRSQWLTRDAAAHLAIRNHLPLAECAHFGQHRTAQAMYDAVVTCYSSPTTAALGRLLLPYLFPKLSAFATVEDLVSHLPASDARYRTVAPAEFLNKNQPPMFITLYFIVTRLPDSLRSVRDHFLSLDPTSLTVDLLEQHLLAAETSATSLVLRMSGLLLLVRSTAAARARVAGVVEGAAGVVVGSGGVGGGGGSGGSGGGNNGGSGGGSGGVGGGGGGSGRSGGSGSGGSGGGRTGAQHGGSVGGQRLRQHPGDCYRCVSPDPGIEAAALGASESSHPGAALAEAVHTFTLDSGASRCFFRDSTTLTPLLAPVPVRLGDPSGGPVVARSSTVLPCPAVPSVSLSGLHLPSFSTILVSTSALQDAMVTTTTPGGQHVSICTCIRMGHHLATFTRRPGSSLYTLATEPPQVASSAQVSASSQVSASGQVAPSCSCRLLSHQTLLWHHRLGHPPYHTFMACTPVSLSLVFPGLCLPYRLRLPRPAFLASRGGSAPLLTPCFPRRLLPCLARVTGQGRERYFLLVVDDYTRPSCLASAL